MSARTASAPPVTPAGEGLISIHIEAMLEPPWGEVEWKVAAISLGCKTGHISVPPGLKNKYLHADNLQCLRTGETVVSDW
jgi:hypothetical protein